MKLSLPLFSLYLPYSLSLSLFFSIFLFLLLFLCFCFCFCCYLYVSISISFSFSFSFSCSFFSSSLFIFFCSRFSPWRRVQCSTSPAPIGSGTGAVWRQSSRSVTTLSRPLPPLPPKSSPIQPTARRRQKQTPTPTPRPPRMQRDGDQLGDQRSRGLGGYRRAAARLRNLCQRDDGDHVWPGF